MSVQTTPTQLGANVAANQYSKNYLLAALITKILQDREVPAVKYKPEFLAEYAKLFGKLVERKNDLPSLEIVKKNYKFAAEETTLTTTDIIEELNKHALKEGIAESVQILIADSKANDISIQEILDKFTTSVSTIRQVVTKAYSVNLATDRAKIVEEYKKEIDGGSFVKTGFEPLDRIVSPKTKNLMLLCAPSKRGKTSCLVKIMSNQIEQGVKTVFFSLEMGLIEITNRLLVNLNEGFTFKDLHFGRVSPEKYGEALDRITTNAIIVTRQNESRISLDIIEQYVIEHKPQVVLVDYLSLIDGANQAWDASVSPTAELKRIGMQNDCFMIVACQSDTATMVALEPPTMTQLRGNKGFSFDCDIFLGVCGVAYFLDNGDDRWKFSFVVSGSRNGGYPEWSMNVRPGTGEWNLNGDDGMVTS